MDQTIGCVAVQEQTETPDGLAEHNPQIVEAGDERDEREAHGSEE